MMVGVAYVSMMYAFTPVPSAVTKKTDNGMHLHVCASVIVQMDVCKWV